MCMRMRQITAIVRVQLPTRTGPDQQAQDQQGSEAAHPGSARKRSAQGRERRHRCSMQQTYVCGKHRTARFSTPQVQPFRTRGADTGTGVVEHFATQRRSSWSPIGAIVASLISAACLSRARLVRGQHGLGKASVFLYRRGNGTLRVSISREAVNKSALSVAQG